MLSYYKTNFSCQIIILGPRETAEINHLTSTAQPTIINQEIKVSNITSLLMEPVILDNVESLYLQTKDEQTNDQVDSGDDTSDDNDDNINNETLPSDNSAEADDNKNELDTAEEVVRRKNKNNLATTTEIVPSTTTPEETTATTTTTATTSATTMKVKQDSRNSARTEDVQKDKQRQNDKILNNADQNISEKIRKVNDDQALIENDKEEEAPNMRKPKKLRNRTKVSKLDSNDVVYILYLRDKRNI